MIDPYVITLVKDILLAVIGPISAILSAYLTNRYAEKRFKEERKDRLLAELVDMRFKALQDINSKMTESYFKLNYYGNVNPETLKEYNEQVKEPLDRFEDALNQNAIWLDEGELKVLNEVRGAFRQMSFAIFLSLPLEQLPQGICPTSYPQSIRTPNWQQFIESFRKARLIIREKLGISELESHLRNILRSA